MPAEAGHLWGGVSMAKRAKSGGATKPATLETGLEVRVPLFMKEWPTLRPAGKAA